MKRILYHGAAFLCAALVALAFFYSMGWRPPRQKETVIVGVSAREPNWNMTMDDGKNPHLDGFMAALWQEIGRRAGWDISFVRADFGALWGMLDRGEIDSIGENASETEPRMVKYNFSEPFYADHSVFLYRRDLGRAEGLSFFAGRTIAVGYANSSSFILRRFMEKGIAMTALPVQKESDVVPAVLEGKAPAGLADASTVRIALKEGSLTLAVYDPGGPVMMSALPFRQDERGRRLSRDASKAIRAMKEDGTLRQLAEKWLYDNLSSMPDGFWPQK